MPKLPVEVIEVIIENLSDDIVTLHTCSLVARGWHARTRVFIFRQVDLKSMPQIKRLLRSLDADKALEGYITSVVVWIVPDPVDRCAQWPSILTVLDPLPILLLQRLPNLEHLDIRHYDVDYSRFDCRDRSRRDRSRRDRSPPDRESHLRSRRHPNPLIHSFLIRPPLVRSLRRCARRRCHFNIS